MFKFIASFLIVLGLVFSGAVHAKSKQKKLRAPPLPPIVVAQIDLSSQKMTVTANGWPVGWWAVSTGRKGFETSPGVFTVKRLEEDWFSRKYDNAPMPHSVFFNGGIAVHGTVHTRSLGRVASHGCVRLHPANAARLFALVKQYGMNRTRIIVVK